MANEHDGDTEAAANVTEEDSTPPATLLTGDGVAVETTTQPHSNGHHHHSTAEETEDDPTMTFVERQNALKVIQGEIHTVWVLLRADARYSSPLRFVEETLEVEEHPLVDELQTLQSRLRTWNHSKKNNNSNNKNAALPLVDYLSPFCSAISGRDISASVTGASLSALHKFLLYGFITPSTPNASEGMTLMAKSLLHCTFEESSSSASSGLSTPGRKSSTPLSHQRSSRRELVSLGGSTNTLSNAYAYMWYEDEQVVLKLLTLATLLIRCAWTTTTSKKTKPLDSKLVVGLLDTCLHVSHRAKNASPLLQSAATDASSQIVLHIFKQQQNDDEEVAKARCDILSQLASLVNPISTINITSSNNNNNDSNVTTCVLTSLTLVNIALETMIGSPSIKEVNILQNDLCKHLLQWSTTHDLGILSLVLRVIFNLFIKIRNQMKVPLEIFLTSVHLRILEHHNTTTATSSSTTTTTPTKYHSSSSSPHHSTITNSTTTSNEQREVALESLLEFCQEPMLMQDLYLNYDCDLNCSNLFESIMETLAKGISTTTTTSISVNALNRLALEGILSVIDSIATKCNGRKNDGGMFTLGGDDDLVSELSEETGESDALTTWSTGNSSSNQQQQQQLGYDDLGGRWQVAEETHKLAQERKRTKHMLSQIATSFNKTALKSKQDWITMGMELELFPSPNDMDEEEEEEEDQVDYHKNPKLVTVLANFLFSAPHLDKVQMGLWLSKGPPERYPLNGAVLKEFCKLYDFTKLENGGFSVALRKFLAKFRLPGEAQCIDRLMEAFSIELYEQQQKQNQQEELEDNTSTLESLEDGTGTSSLKKQQQQKLPFQSSDAVFAMAFSTIMLNTDLHNPGMKDEKRMTLEQFIRNNRGLNEGTDFPREFLQSLYYEIQNNELMVQRDFMEMIRRHIMQEGTGEGGVGGGDGSTEGGGGSASAAALPAKHWEGILSRVHEPAYFTPASEAHQTMEASIHDRDMFVTIARAVTRCISDVFVRSASDALVVRTLVGFQQMAKICVYFDLDETFNEILQILLGHGRDYIMSCIALEYAGYEGGQILAGDTETSESRRGGGLPSSPPVVVTGGTTTAAPDSVNSAPIPKEFLIKSPSWAETTEIVGSAAHRGLLALDCGFSLIRTQPDRIRDSWPTLIECLCALRDARALPERVIFLDDFADSRGNLLPLSPFAKQSQRRLDEYYRSLSDRDNRRGWFGGLINAISKRNLNVETTTEMLFTGEVDGGDDEGGEMSNEKELSTFSQSLLHVTKRAKLEQVVLMRPKNLPLAKQTIRALLDAIDAYPYFEDPIFEQHAVYSLELALLSLISNRDRVVELYPMFLLKFDAVLDGGTKRSSGGRDATERHIPTPFLMERVVVSILRSCIHLYDIPEIRAQLRTSLHLLMSLPPSFTRYVSDRIACGMAIFLSQKFHLLESSNEWSFITDMLNSLAYYGPARGFVFDGIANTVESQMTTTTTTTTMGNDRDIDVPVEEGEVMVEEEDEDASADDSRVLGEGGSEMLNKLLLKFVFGTYQNDMSLSIPAMMCLENLYRHTVNLWYKAQGRSSELASGAKLQQFSVPDPESWQNIAVAFYSVCRNLDANASRQGTDCFQRFMASTEMSSITDEKWLLLLVLIVNKQPSITAEETRVNCCTILCKVLLMTIAHLTKTSDKANLEDLTDVVNQMALLVGENLREGRRGSVSPLFESTLQSVTFLCNHLVSNEYTGDEEYGAWVSDTLLAELEKFGAAGAAQRNLAATLSKRDATAMRMNSIGDFGPIDGTIEEDGTSTLSGGGTTDMASTKKDESS